MDKTQVEGCCSPKLIEEYQNQGYEIAVVIDVLRATSTMCYALESGVESIIPISSLEEAIEFKKKGFLVGAERNGKVVDGFDFGNSPLHFKGKTTFKNQSIVMTTTNGTKTIQLSKMITDHIIIASLTNLTAVVNYLKKHKKKTLIITAGWKNKVSIEDSLCGGLIVHYLTQTNEWFFKEDEALCARLLAQSALKSNYQPLRYASHRRRLSHLHADIMCCIDVDRHSFIPIYNVETNIISKFLGE